MMDEDNSGFAGGTGNLSVKGATFRQSFWLKYIEKSNSKFL